MNSQCNFKLPMTPTVKDIVLSCGGASVVARHFSLTAHAVHKWSRVNSIPKKYWHGLQKLNPNLTLLDITKAIA